MSVFPLEVYENIIDQLVGVSNLKATSLVCKDWLPRSRFRLFHPLRLYSQKIRDFPDDLVAKARDQLLQTFRDGNLASFITGLFLDSRAQPEEHFPVEYDSDDSEYRDYDDYVDAAVAWDARFRIVQVPLESLLDLASFRLSALRFLRVQWNALPYHTRLTLFYQLLRCSPLLEHLVIQDVESMRHFSVTAAALMLEIRANMGNLKTICLKNILDSEAGPAIMSPLVLDRLFLQSVDQQFFECFDWALLRILGLSAATLRKIILSPDFQPNFGQSLQELTISNLDMVLADFNDLLSSIHLPMVSTLRIIAGTGKDIPPFLELLAWHKSIMPNLRDIQMSLILHEHTVSPDGKLMQELILVRAQELVAARNPNLQLIALCFGLPYQEEFDWWYTATSALQRQAILQIPDTYTNDMGQIQASIEKDLEKAFEWWYEY